MSDTGMLSEYLDGELDRDAAGALEARLARKPDLRVLLEELRAVRQAAANAPTFDAPAGLWTAVRARIEADAGAADHGVSRPVDGRSEPAGPVPAAPRRRRFALTLPQLAAAAAILLLLGVGLGRMAVPGTAPDETPVASQSSPDQPGRVVAAERPGSGTYAGFVSDLESRLEAGRDVLDPETARVIEESLAKIDTAIVRAHEALEADPNNAYLNQHLASARSRKVRLLESATALIASRT